MLKAVVEPPRPAPRRRRHRHHTEELLRARAARLAPRWKLIPERRRPPTTFGLLWTAVALPGRPNPLRPAGSLRKRVSPDRRRGHRPRSAPCSCCVAGGGPLRTDLDARAEEHKARPVEALGVVEAGQATGGLRRRSGRLRSGATVHGGTSQVLLEAMACGLPCVASDCAGNRSLITDRGDRGSSSTRTDRTEHGGAPAADLRRPACTRGAPREGGEEMVAARYDLSALVGARDRAGARDRGPAEVPDTSRPRTRCPLRDTQHGGPTRATRPKPERVEVEIHDLGLWGSVLRRPKAGAFVLGRGYTIMMHSDGQHAPLREAARRQPLDPHLRREPIGKAAR